MFMVVWKCNGINLYNYETRTRVLDNNAHHKNAKSCKLRIGITGLKLNELSREKTLNFRELIKRLTSEIEIQNSEYQLE